MKEKGMYILCCNECGKMYKATKHKDKIGTYVTDFGDELNSCMKCNGSFHVISTADWIADLVFTIKGK